MSSCELYEILSYRLAMTESELALAEQKANDYSVIINRLKQELSDSSSVHQSDIRREREVISQSLTLSLPEVIKVGFCKQHRSR